MNAEGGIIILLNFLLVQSKPPTTIYDWTVIQDMHDNGDKVILIGEQRSWTISNAVVKQYIEYSESDFVLLCDIENSQGIIKGVIRFFSERDYTTTMDFFKKDYNGIFPVIQDHGRIAIEGKTIYFVITASIMPLHFIHYRQVVGWPIEMIAHLGIIYMMKLHYIHFSLEATIKDFKYETLCIPFNDPHQFLFNSVYENNEEENRISDVLNLVQILLKFSMSPGTSKSPLINKPWTALKLDTSALETEMKHATLNEVPDAFKEICKYVLDKKNQPLWKDDYGKIIGLFNKVKSRGISTEDGFLEWVQTANSVMRTYSKKLQDCKFKASDLSKTKNPTWAYISLRAHMHDGASK